MFSLRTLALLALTVFMLPRDPAQQQRFSELTASGVEWASTYCERNAGTCEVGARVWADMKDKASFGFALAYDLAMRQMSRSGAPEPAMAPAYDGRLPSQRHGRDTLTPEDLKPVWRGHP